MIKIISTLILTISLSAYSQNWRHVIPNVSDLAGGTSYFGELSLTDAGSLQIRNSHGDQALNYDHVDNKVPTYLTTRWYIDGENRFVVIFKKGSVKIGGDLYTNSTDVYCRHDIAATSASGGYDNSDPFSSNDIAYIYLVPNGTGFNCVLSSSHDGLLDESISPISLFVGSAFYEDSYYVELVVSNGEEHSFPLKTSGLRKNINCQALTIENIPKNLDYLLFSFNFYNETFGMTSASLYFDGNCTKKIQDVPITWSSNWGGGFIGLDFLTSNTIYVKGVISGAENSNLQNVELLGRGKFKKKLFKQGVL